MSEILKHVGVFLGIISFFSGIAVLSINLVFCQDKENRYYRILRKYHMAFFAYILVIFAYYYVEQFFLDERELAAINILGNVTLAILCISHAKIITYLNQSENSRRYRILLTANMLYVFGWIVINILWMNGQGFVNVQPGIAVVWGIEIVLFIALMIFAVGEFRQRQKNNWLYFFLSIFVVEYLWEVMYDLTTAEPFFMFTYAVRPFNIVFVIYILVNIILLAGLYRKLLQKKMTETQSEKEKQELLWDQQMKKKMDGYGLTARECEILQLILDGKSNQEIADGLFISQNTVKRHISNILKKTGANQRTELVLLFLEKHQ